MEQPARVTLRVWAPRARGVEVVTGAEKVVMTRERGGWWSGQVSEVQALAGYAFRVDGGRPLPDPRSPSQPHGVHGRSQWVDHAAFPWTDASWRPPPFTSAVLYELHVGAFTPEGTFDGAIARLDALVDLGITHVELMPVAAFSGARGWGYDGVDLFAPHASYGGPDGLKRLVDACHSRGLAVLLDVVYNHLGPEGCYLASFGPYFTSRHATPWGQAVNLDGRRSAEVRRFFCDNALMWLRDYHLDGLRLDAVQTLVDASARHLLAQLAAEVEALQAELGRPLTLIAESDLNDPRYVREPSAGGLGLHAQWSEDLHHALHAALTGERVGYFGDYGALAHLAKALERGHVYDGLPSAFRGRPHGQPSTGLSGHQLVTYLQNHDQIGNRPRGERIGHLVSPGLQRIGAALSLCAPSIPMLFMGEEWGASTPFLYFTDHSDRGLGRAVREGRRREAAEFGWRPGGCPDPQDVQTFERSRLRWEERDQAPHASLLDWYRALIRLRRSTPSLLDGRLEATRVRFDEGARWLVLERGEIAVACNLAGRAQKIPLEGASSARVLLHAGVLGEPADSCLQLGAEAVAIVQLA